MPRRRAYRRRKVNRLSRYRKRWNRKSRYNKKGQKIYLFKRHVNFDVINVNNIVPTLAGLTFRLNQVPNYTEFTNLYDMYKINGVKMVFIPKQNQSISIGSVNNASPTARFFTALDYNDATPPTTVDDIREYQSCKFTSVIRTHKRYIPRPRIQDRGQTYNPGRPWINCSAPDQEHYGLKLAIEPISSTTTTDMPYSVECVFYMSFRNVK